MLGSGTGSSLLETSMESCSTNSGSDPLRGPGSTPGSQTTRYIWPFFLLSLPISLAGQIHCEKAIFTFDGRTTDWNIYQSELYPWCSLIKPFFCAASNQYLYVIRLALQRIHTFVTFLFHWFHCVGATTSKSGPSQAIASPLSTVVYPCFV